MKNYTSFYFARFGEISKDIRRNINPDCWIYSYNEVYNNNKIVIAGINVIVKDELVNIEHKLPRDIK